MVNHNTKQFIIEPHFGGRIYWHNLHLWVVLSLCHVYLLLHWRYQNYLIIIHVFTLWVAVFFEKNQEFYLCSILVPLVSRMLPSDVCKISKKGSCIRWKQYSYAYLRDLNVVSGLCHRIWINILNLEFTCIKEVDICSLFYVNYSNRHIYYKRKIYKKIL